MDQDQSQLVQYLPDGSVKVSASTPAEAKLAVRELKIHRRELAAKLSAMKAAERQSKAGRSSLTRSKGLGASIVRGMQVASRESAAREAANQRAPIERRINEVDRLILQIEQWIVQQKS